MGEILTNEQQLDPASDVTVGDVLSTFESQGAVFANFTAPVSFDAISDLMNGVDPAQKSALESALTQHMTDLTPEQRQQLLTASLLVGGVLRATRYRLEAENIFSNSQISAYQPSLFEDGLLAHLS